MEKQMERSNPVRGSGAVPSMGLSQYCGGANSLQYPDRMGDIMEGRDVSSDPMVSRVKRRGGSKKMSEAMAMGLHLGKHLHSLHGGSFHKQFAEGVCRGGAWWDFLDPSKNGVGDAFNKVKNEFVNPDSMLRGTILPEAGDIAGKVAAATAFIPGLGEVVAPVAAGIKAAATANNMAKGVGLGRHRGGGLLGQDGHGVRVGAGKGGSLYGVASPTGAYEGKGKKRRAPAGPSDGRRARAEIVKRIMREKKMSMIEASKYVKQHNLY
jgi:hypothetical protein